MASELTASEAHYETVTVATAENPFGVTNTRVPVPFLSPGDIVSSILLVSTNLTAEGDKS